MAGLWAGIDWSEQLNDVAVVDRTGTVVARARVPETPDGVKDLLRLLAGLRSSRRHSPKHVPVAIGTGRGAGEGPDRRRADRRPPQPCGSGPLPRPAAAYATQERHVRRRAARAHPAHRRRLHRPLTVHTDQAEAIQVLARAQRRALYGRQYQYNQPRSLLREVHPAALTAWSELPGNLLRGEARTVLTAATPSRAARLTKRSLFDLLQQGGRARMLDDRAARLHTHFRVPVLRQRPAVEEAMGQQILMSLALLAVDALTVQVQEAFEAHPQAKIYLSFPGCGALTGARLLAELGDDPRPVRRRPGPSHLRPRRTAHLGLRVEFTGQPPADREQAADGDRAHPGVRQPDPQPRLPGAVRRPPRGR